MTLESGPKTGPLLHLAAESAMAQDPTLNHARAFLRGELRSDALRKAFELTLRLAWISGYGAVRSEALEELRRQTRAADEQVLLLERQVALLQAQRDQASAPGLGSG